MSKPRMFAKQFYVNFSALEWAFVNYYSKTYGRDRRDVVRSMVQIYVNADKGFDPKKFMSFVKSELTPGEEDEAMADEILRQAEEYAKDRQKADAPTQTMPGKRR